MGVAPRHLVLSPDGATAYLAETGYGIAFIDVQKERIFKRVRVGQSPKSIVLSKDGRFLYSSDYRGHSLSIVDTQTFETVRMKLNILRSSGIDVHPNDGFIYISGWCTNDVWAIQRVNPGRRPPFLSESTATIAPAMPAKCPRQAAPPSHRSKSGWAPVNPRSPTPDQLGPGHPELVWIGIAHKAFLEAFPRSFNLLRCRRSSRPSRPRESHPMHGESIDHIVPVFPRDASSSTIPERR